MDDSDGCRAKYQFGFYVGHALLIVFFFLNMDMAPMKASCTPRLPFASGCDLYELKSLAWSEQFILKIFVFGALVSHEVDYGYLI